MSRSAPADLQLAEEGISRFQIHNSYFEGQNNVYLIEGRELALVDTGIGTPEALVELESALDRRGYGLHNLRHVLLTHKHVDHFGLAHAIWERSSARVYVHHADYDEVVHFAERRSLVTERYRAFMAEWGVPEETIRSLAGLSAAFGKLSRSVPAEPLYDGQFLALGDSELKIIHTPGHTRGSVCFQYKKMLFSGDHLLPDYTPNIGATDMDAAELLSQYLSSLEKVQRLSKIKMVLPGHGEPITALSERITAIAAHHQERLQQTQEALSEDEPRSVYQIALRLFGPLREHHVLLGCGEVHAHLAVLISQGRVKQVSVEPTRYVREC